MGVRTRVTRLERDAAGRAENAPVKPVVFVRLPYNGRGPPLPGEYLSLDGRVLTVIYESVVTDRSDIEDWIPQRG
ncbi:hypothetical protein [Fimbriiglobus ruber]|uniref:Uncharacterized protein n=1 Tax=Fimbriiglobus ruber TaxID=1908690 RepID=A0A225DER3_9BACT|nr:hypothetical protein [Fimbriiglobus ruber]OWK39952.1 hypothetical protein FRUB_05842 [Fimbriiglobus ruber]